MTAVASLDVPQAATQKAKDAEATHRAKPTAENLDAVRKAHRTAYLARNEAARQAKGLGNAVGETAHRGFAKGHNEGSKLPDDAHWVTINGHPVLIGGEKDAALSLIPSCPTCKCECPDGKCPNCGSLPTPTGDGDGATVLREDLRASLDIPLELGGVSGQAPTTENSMPTVEVPIILDMDTETDIAPGLIIELGDVAGHEFHGNQYTHQGAVDAVKKSSDATNSTRGARAGRPAVDASDSAKRLVKDGWYSAAASAARDASDHHYNIAEQPGRMSRLDREHHVAAGNAHFTSAEYLEGLARQNGQYLRGDKITIKPEWRDPGDENRDFRVVEDRGTHAIISHDAGLPINPQQSVSKDMIEPYHAPATALPVLPETHAVSPEQQLKDDTRKAANDPEMSAYVNHKASMTRADTAAGNALAAAGTPESIQHHLEAAGHLRDAAKTARIVAGVYEHRGMKPQFGPNNHPDKLEDLAGRHEAMAQGARLRQQADEQRKAAVAAGWNPEADDDSGQKYADAHAADVAARDRRSDAEAKEIAKTETDPEAAVAAHEARPDAAWSREARDARDKANQADKDAEAASKAAKAVKPDAGIQAQLTAHHNAYKANLHAVGVADNAARLVEKQPGVKNEGGHLDAMSKKRYEKMEYHIAKCSRLKKAAKLAGQKVTLSRDLILGDVAGHEFHGNQWSGAADAAHKLNLKAKKEAAIVHEGNQRRGNETPAQRAAYLASNVAHQSSIAAKSGEMPGSKMDGHNFAEMKQKQAAEANRKAGNSFIAELHDKSAAGHHAASIAAWNDIHGVADNTVTKPPVAAKNDGAAKYENASYNAHIAGGDAITAHNQMAPKPGHAVSPPDESQHHWVGNRLGDAAVLHLKAAKLAEHAGDKEGTKEHDKEAQGLLQLMQNHVSGAGSHEFDDRKGKLADHPAFQAMKERADDATAKAKTAGAAYRASKDATPAARADLARKAEGAFREAAAKHVARSDYKTWKHHVGRATFYQNKAKNHAAGV